MARRGSEALSPPGSQPNLLLCSTSHLSGLEIPPWFAGSGSSMGVNGGEILSQQSPSPCPVPFRLDLLESTLPFSPPPPNTHTPAGGGHEIFILLLLSLR